MVVMVLIRPMLVAEAVVAQEQLVVMHLVHTEVAQAVKVVLDCSLQSQVQIQHMLAVVVVVEHRVVVRVLFMV
jgi:hypothetical protein